MKSLWRLLYGFLLFLMVLSACSPQPAPPEVSTAPPPLTQPPEVSTASSAVKTVSLAGPQIGTTMRWADDSLLVYVPGGTFQMGGDTLDNQQHIVSLTSFWIYRSEVTNREYALCVNAGICQPPGNDQALQAFKDGNLADNPVAGVNWNQAQSYCGWVRGSLPTEAQWEYAARGTDSNLYPWGDATPTCDLADFKDCTGGTSKVTDHAMGQSPFQVFDLAGNVFEWVGDRYDGTYYSSSPDVDPPGPDNGNTRVVRSSSYLSGQSDLPVNQRFQLDPEKNRQDLGFRCVVQTLSYFAPACQTPLVYAPGSSRGSSAGGNCPAPSVGSPINGCNAGSGFGRAEVTGSFTLSGAPSDCSQDGGSVLCTSPDRSDHSYTVQVCGSCAPPAGEAPADTTCMDGYMPRHGEGTACDFAPGSCPAGHQPTSDGLCTPDACLGSSGGGLDPFGAIGAALGCMAAVQNEGGPICQSGYILVNTASFTGCARPDAIPADACPAGTYYDTGTGGCARPAGSTGGACPSGMSPYAGGACIPSDCADVLGAGGSCFGFGCLEATFCAAAAAGNATCQTGYAFVADVGCVPLSDGSTASGSGGTPVPGTADFTNPCLAGSTFDAVNNCCQANTPSCPAGSALSGETCVVPAAAGGGSPGSCTTVSIYAPACGNTGGGGNPCVGLDYDACKLASGSGCSWNGTSCH